MRKISYLISLQFIKEESLVKTKALKKKHENMYIPRFYKHEIMGHPEKQTFEPTLATSEALYEEHFID